MTKPLFRTAALGALATLSACAVGPNYVRPSAPGETAFVKR